MLALLLRKLNSPLLRLATSGSLHSTSSGFSWSMDMFGYNKWYESLSQLTCDRMANTLPPSCANGLPYASAFSPLPSSFVPAPKRKAPRVLDQVGRRHLGLDLTASTHNTYIYIAVVKSLRPPDHFAAVASVYPSSNFRLERIALDHLTICPSLLKGGTGSGEERGLRMRSMGLFNHFEHR